MSQIDHTDELVVKQDLKDFYDKIYPYLNTVSACNYSESERVVGTWIDGKPVYEKTIVDTLPETSTDGVTVSKNILLNTPIDKVISIIAIRQEQGIRGAVPLEMSIFSDDTFKRIGVAVYGNGSTIPNRVKLENSSSVVSNMEVYVTVRYTKTTD